MDSRVDRGKDRRDMRTAGWTNVRTRGGNQNWRSKTRPSMERCERLYFFDKPKAKIVPSTAIFVDCCRSQCLGINFYTFKVKKTSCLLPLPSKVVSINLSIIPFLKFKI